MMKKLFLTAAALLTVAASTQAQDVAIGVKGGITIPSITPGGKKTPLSEGYSSRLAWGAGAYAEIKFTDLFSITAGLEYSGQGGKKDKVQAVPAADILNQMLPPMKTGLTQQLVVNGIPEAAAQAVAGQLDNLFPDDYLYADFKAVARFNYLMLPVQARFGWNLSKTSPLRFYANAGFFASYLLKAERYTTGISPFYADRDRTSLSAYAANAVGGLGLDAATSGILAGFVTGVATELDADRTQFNKMTQDITDEIYRFNFGIIGAIGLSWQISPRHGVFIEGGGNYGFKKIQKNDTRGQNRIGAGTVMLGYSYNL